MCLEQSKKGMNFKMKKYKIIVLTLSFIVLSFSNSIAASAKVTATTTKNNIKLEEETQINILIQGSKCAAYNLEIYFDDTKVEYIKQDENTSISGNKVTKVWYDETGGLNAIDGIIANFKWKAIGEGICNFVLNGEFYDANGNEIETEFQNVTISIGEDNNVSTSTTEAEEINANLENLAIENVLLTPPFDANITNYKAEISNATEDIKILAVPQNDKNTVNVIGNKDLKEGNNTISITVTSKGGETQKIYTVDVYKRNAEEEKTYQEEQEANRNQLNKIYQEHPELLSTMNSVQEVEQSSKQEELENENKDSKNFYWKMLWNSVTLIIFEKG